MLSEMCHKLHLLPPDLHYILHILGFKVDFVLIFPNSWVLYEEPNYRGRMYIVERKNYCNFMEWQAENHNIQSVRRVANYF